MEHVLEHGTANASGERRFATGLSFRPAQASDAEAAAPLIFASGIREFSFFLGEPPEVCTAFLRFAFASKWGRFSWRRHRVAVAGDGSVLSLLAIHDGRTTLLDDPHIAFALLRFFRVRRTVAILWRGLALESELPAPRRGQVLFAHCATLEGMRGRGAFSELFEFALRADTLGIQQASRERVLDVLISNRAAFALYKRLGFVALPRTRSLSRRLPEDLESVRMRFRIESEATRD
jgi:ribosomal protein S18 acetylase RimI-like enzyme